jgi:hypothetical protein
VVLSLLTMAGIKQKRLAFPLVNRCSLSSSSQYNSELNQLIAILLDRIRIMSAGTESYTPPTKVSQMRTQ